jgi:hypothetical protein
MDNNPQTHLHRATSLRRQCDNQPSRKCRRRKRRRIRCHKRTAKPLYPPGTLRATVVAYITALLIWTGSTHLLSKTPHNTHPSIQPTYSQDLNPANIGPTYFQ